MFAQCEHVLACIETIKLEVIYLTRRMFVEQKLILLCFHPCLLTYAIDLPLMTQTVEAL